MPVGVRWTIGDVSDYGFEALRLSILGARRIFGPDAALAVVVNNLPLDEAQRRCGPLPVDLAADLNWLEAHGLPDRLQSHLDAGMAEGVAWKLAPLRLWPERHELSLDNDCLLFECPSAVSAWLTDADRPCVLAADVKRANGAFEALAGPKPLNTGIRGLPPGFDLEEALLRVLARHPVPLRSELDEQGLQVVAMQLDRPALVVETEEVTICSPFWPHQPWLGSKGAHFVGLNARSLPWRYYDRPATDCVIENWKRHKPELERRVSAPVAGMDKPAAPRARKSAARP